MPFILAQTETPAAPAGEITSTPGSADPAKSTPPGSVGQMEFFVPLMIVMVVFYIFIFRSKRKQDRKRSEMLQQLKRGDRIQTIGGILGTVVEARDTDVVIKVDESNNIKIRFARSAIHRVLDEDKSEAK